jgi:hypothetical protein
VKMYELKKKVSYTSYTWIWVYMNLSKALSNSICLI